MAKSDVIEVEGKITEVMPGKRYVVLLDQGHTVNVKVSGKMKLHRIQLVKGDRVKVAISPYDLNIGTITYRCK